MVLLQRLLLVVILCCMIEINKNKVDHRFGGCCTDNNFLGSSRTYVYFANQIRGANIPVGTPSAVQFGNGRLQCLNSARYIYGVNRIEWISPGDVSYVNTLNYNSELLPIVDRSRFIEASKILESEESNMALIFQDRLEYTFDQRHTSEYMSHYPLFGTESFRSPLAWQDDARINGILSPIFLAGWINCFGQPCYDCYWRKNIDCGSGPEQMMNNLSKLIDEYYSKIGYRPYEGFYEDWHGIINRDAEPITGWYLYVIFGTFGCAPCGLYDEYCSCCWFCFSKDCIEPFFIAKITGSSILTLNSKRGIPYNTIVKLQEYKQRAEEVLEGDSKILLNDIADEIVFCAGDADWKLGDIDNYRFYAPWTGFSGIVFNRIRGVSERQVPFDNGSGRNIILYGTEYPVQMGRNGGGFLVRDMLVVNKKEDNELSGSLAFERPWIHVDIPPTFPSEKSYIAHTADAGNLPDLAYGVGLEWGPVSAFPFLNTRHKNLFVRSAKNGGTFMKYTVGEGNYFQDGLTFFNAVPAESATLIYYYKQGLKKIVKAPYNLYLRSGDTTFRQCMLGESLNLSPGRYYFPNPAVANRQLFLFDPDFKDLDEMGLVANEDADLNFADYFNTYYRQFNIDIKFWREKETFARFDPIEKVKKQIAENDNNLEKKLSNAIDLLGSPYNPSGSVRLEYGGEFDDTNFSFWDIVFNAASSDAAFTEALEAYLKIDI